MSDLLDRVAGAPITWGVDGSPGWGYLMDRDRVMREMVESDFTAAKRDSIIKLAGLPFVPALPFDTVTVTAPPETRIAATPSCREIASVR